MVGWLIVEDILTVLALVILPIFSEPNASYVQFFSILGIALLKVVGFAGATLVIGGKIAPWFLGKIAKTKSRELFTLTILVIAFSIATIASIYFGVSFALGAFLAGMVVGNTSVHHQATSDILPMKDAFSVLFFISVGMLVDPTFILANIWFVLSALIIVIVLKALVAFSIVTWLGYNIKTALTVAIGLAQIGEFSFILAQEAQSHGIVGAEAYSIFIACAIISISLNPILFRMIPSMEKFFTNGKIFRFLINRNEEKSKKYSNKAKENIEKESPEAIIIGFGPVGRSLEKILNEKNKKSVIIDMNLETVDELIDNGIHAIFGNAEKRDILIEAGVRNAKYIFVTLPDSDITINIVSEIMKINNEIKIFARTKYKGNEELLKQIGVYKVFAEENAVSYAMGQSLENDL